MQVHRYDWSSPLCVDCAVRMAVSSVTIHPSYDSTTFDNDVAVLHLVEPIPDAIDLPAVSLDDGTLDEPGTTLVIAGWGALANAVEGQTTPFPQFLQAAEVMVRFVFRFPEG